MDAEGWETVSRKDERRSSSPKASTQDGRKSRSKSPRSRGCRDGSRSPPPDCMPSPKAQSKLVNRRSWSLNPGRQDHEPRLCVQWRDENAFSSQVQKKGWQERLVRSREVPCGASIAIIRAGVHASEDDPDRIQHVTVDYRDKDRHLTTRHIDLTEAEYHSFKMIEQPDQAILAVEPVPGPALDDATLWPPLSP